MCDYGDYVEKMGTEKGLQRGILQGKEQGFLQGSENKTVEDIQSLTKTLKLSVNEAMDALQIPIEEKAYYLKLLSEKNIWKNSDCLKNYLLLEIITYSFLYHRIK